MIFVDASAIVALILAEPEAAALAAALDQGEPAFTSAIAIYEASLAIARVRNIPVAVSRSEVRIMLARIDVAVASVEAEHAELALAAFETYGKGRHPARLNMGDCFAYAATAIRQARILFKGDDFSKTDLASALPTSST